MRWFRSASQASVRTTARRSAPDAEMSASWSHRDQAGLQRLIELDVVVHGAVEHRLAVFVLADLQIRGVGGAFDELPAV